MKYVYPAIFTPLGDGAFDVKVPDLPGCRTCGDATLTVSAPQFTNYIAADTDEYRKKYDNRAIKKTLSIPSWLNTQAEQAGVNFSQVLQEALKEKLQIG